MIMALSFKPALCLQDTRRTLNIHSQGHVEACTALRLSQLEIHHLSRLTDMLMCAFKSGLSLTAASSFFHLETEGPNPVAELELPRQPVAERSPLNAQMMLLWVDLASSFFST